MADMVNKVKVYSDEMEVLDYINEVLTPDVKTAVLKKLDSRTGNDVLITFFLQDQKVSYYAVLIRSGEFEEDFGSLTLLLAKEKEDIYNYLTATIETLLEEEDHYKPQLFYNKRIIMESFEDIDKKIRDDTTSNSEEKTSSTQGD